MTDFVIGNKAAHAPTMAFEGDASGVIKAGPGSLSPIDKGLSPGKNRLTVDSPGIIGGTAPVMDQDGAKPVLTAPKSAVTSKADFVQSLELVVQRMEEDPVYLANSVAFYARMSPAVLPSGLPSLREGFDINGMNSFSPVALIMLLLHLLDSLRTTDAALNAKMTVSAAEAVDRTVAALEKQGHHQLVGALTQTVLGTVLTVGSVGLKAIAENKIYKNSTLNGAAMQKSKGEANSLKNTLDGVKPAPVAGEIAELKVKTAGGADTAVGVAPSNKTLSEADKNIIATQLKESDDITQAAHTKASDANLHEADHYKLAGDGLGGLNTAISGVASAYFGEKVTGAQAKQKLSELDKEVVSNTSREAGTRTEAADAKTRELIQLAAQMLNALADTGKSLAQGIRG